MWNYYFFVFMMLKVFTSVISCGNAVTYTYFNGVFNLFVWICFLGIPSHSFSSKGYETRGGLGVSLESQSEGSLQFLILELTYEEDALN